MPKIMALWNQPDRNITPAQAGEIFANSGKGACPDLEYVDVLRELRAVVAENAGSMKILNENDDRFILLEISDDAGITTEYDLLFFAIDNDLLLYDGASGVIMCACGRYGIGRYVLAHENTRIVDDPSPSAMKDELKLLDDIDNTFAILEGPEGYVQTAMEEDGTYTVEWNRGGIEKHYILDSTGADLEQTVKIFDAFLTGNISYLEGLDWCRLEFTQEDFES